MRFWTLSYYHIYKHIIHHDLRDWRIAKFRDKDISLNLKNMVFTEIADKMIKRASNYYCNYELLYF